MAFLLPVVLLLASTAATTTTTMGGSLMSVMPGCQGSCGGVDIPYPFGIGNGCFRQGFEIVCNSIVPGVEVPVLAAVAATSSSNSAIRVVNLSVVPSPEARVLVPVAWQCFNATGDITGSSMGDVTFNPQGVYRVSNNSNELYVLGCNTFVYAEGGQGGRFRYGYYAGCVAVTNDTRDAQDGSCAGLGCCHVDIPPGITDFTMSMSSGGSWSHANQSFCPCDYAFIVENGAYTFMASDLTSSSELKNQTMQMVLDWAIRDNGSASVSCAQATNRDGYACLSTRSECINSTNGPGYFCRCTQGSEGNPYVLDGCASPRKFNKAIVAGTVGGGAVLLVAVVVGAVVAVFHYPKRKDDGSELGDETAPLQQGNGQHESLRRGNMSPVKLSLSVVTEHPSKMELWVIILIAAACVSLTGFVAALVYHILMQRQAQIEVPLPVAREFSYHELSVATKNFSEKIGQGAFGIVYRGKLRDPPMTPVAVKVLTSHNDEQTRKDYVTEIMTLGQSNHRNIMKLVGWCSHGDKLLLVYELVTNGSLSEHLHHKSERLLTWAERYKIVLGVGSAIEYLHTGAQNPILHRDIKPSNVMLDGALEAKLGDFGLVRHAPGQGPLKDTTIIGSLDYMDPVCISTKTTEPASDMYSFGVLLLEVATGRMPQVVEAPGLRNALVDAVRKSYSKGAVLEMADARLDGNFDKSQMERVLVVGLLCVQQDRLERPGIREAVNFLSTDAQRGELLSEAEVSAGERLAAQEHQREEGPSIKEELKKVLDDETARPIDLPLWFLKYITKDFSDGQLIGKGGFGAVYRGEIGGEMIVAVKKLINYGVVINDSFEQEITFLINTKHKNIVRLLGYCSDTKRAVKTYEGKLVLADSKEERLICFEYLSNKSLDKHLTDPSSGLEWRVRYQIIKGICEGLCYLHEKNIIHRDLKPENILLDHIMVPKIADFGISRLFAAKQSHATTIQRAGTPIYMAPEYFGKGTIAKSIDIYSLGVIIIYILMGCTESEEFPNVDEVLEKWESTFGASSENHALLDQVNVCAEIGRDCRDSDPKNRPTITEIICRLGGTDISNSSIRSVASTSLAGQLVDGVKSMAVSSALSQ